MRCGFCNLFTTVTHNHDLAHHYVRTLQRQAERVSAALGKGQFARLAIGGGTPTQLPLSCLAAIFDIAETVIGAAPQAIPVSVEVSPETATVEKLQLLRDRGVDRISMGVQSFIDSEVLAIQRRQTAEQVHAALERIRTMGFGALNLDLIYGLPQQTVDSWLHSIRTALQFQPEELYLYPLYVRPLTGMGLSQQAWDDSRLACYRASRELLLTAGYTQVSMRMFRAPHTTDAPGPVYCCQADGMVGLGCGARSYTRSLHYSYDYAVNSREIKSILANYIASDDKAFEIANYGFDLNLEEQQRRFILLSLLSDQGLDLLAYGDLFHTDALTDFPELPHLHELKLIKQNSQRLYLTDLGVERSDAIGPSLFSSTVHTLMQEYEIK